jgi:putative transposase
MTPHDIHHGLAAAKWQQRAAMLRAAYEAHPERFPRGVPLPTAAWINKPSAGITVAPSDVPSEAHES